MDHETFTRSGAGTSWGKGPAVLEVPPAGPDGSLYGQVVDAWRFTIADVNAITTAVPAAVERYRTLERTLGSNTPGVNIEARGEIIRSVADQIPVRSGPDGVPVAILGLNAAKLAAASGSDIGMVAGACFGLIQ